MIKGSLAIDGWANPTTSVETRWNSIYDRLVDIVNRNVCETHEELQLLQ